MVKNLSRVFCNFVYYIYLYFLKSRAGVHLNPKKHAKYFEFDTNLTNCNSAISVFAKSGNVHFLNFSGV